MTTNKFVLSAFFLLVSPWLAGSGRASEIYVLSNHGAGGLTSYGKIDVATGNYTAISADVGSGTSVENPTWGPASGSFYVTSNDGDDLRTLSTTGVLSSIIGSPSPRSGLWGMTYRAADSSLYAYDYWYDELVTISTADGNMTTVGSTGVTTGGDKAGHLITHNNVIYAAGTIDGSGKFGSFAPDGTFQQIAANNLFANMMLASDGVDIYGLSDDSNIVNLYSITTSGGLTQLHTITMPSGFDYLQGIAQVTVAPVPEPATVGLTALGLAGAGFALLRRRARRA